SSCWPPPRTRPTASTCATASSPRLPCASTPAPTSPGRGPTPTTACPPCATSSAGPATTTAAGWPTWTPEAPMHPLLLAFAFPLPLSLGWTSALTHLAPRLGLMDRPDPRKVHSHPTPRAGGLAVFAAFAAAVLLGPDGPPPFGLTLLALGVP